VAGGHFQNCSEVAEKRVGEGVRMGKKIIKTNGAGKN